MNFSNAAEVESFEGGKIPILSKDIQYLIIARYLRKEDIKTIVEKENISVNTFKNIYKNMTLVN